MATTFLKPTNGMILGNFSFSSPSFPRPHQLRSLPKKAIMKSKLSLPSLSISSCVVKASGSIGEGSERDLLIVGPGGLLGTLIAEKWQEEFPGCRVYQQVIGIKPEETQPSRLPYVVFTFSSPADMILYRAALTRWNKEGSFLFVTPLSLPPGIVRQVERAEKAVIKEWGSVLRWDSNATSYAGAASFYVDILKKKYRRRILMGLDDFY